MGNQRYNSPVSPKPWGAPMPGQRSLWSAFRGRRGLLVILAVLGTVAYFQLGPDKGKELIETIRLAKPLSRPAQQPLNDLPAKLLNPKPIKSTTPAAKFRDNLLPKERYVYANHAYGLNTQFVQLCKVITMGHRMERTPLFDNLHPEHGEGSFPRASDFFDFVPALNRLNISFVEFADLKTSDPTLQEEEDLSGYAAFGPTVRKEGLQPYKIRTHFWPIPPTLSLYPTMSTIELLGQRPPWDWIEENGERIWEERKLPTPGPPDEVVLTLDQAFFVREARFQDGVVDFHESPEDVDPESFTWQEVGQHIRFQPWVDRLATDFLAALFAARPNPDVPATPTPAPAPAPKTGAFIAVHLRQGDFARTRRAVGEVGLPEAFHEAVAEVQDELVDRFGAGVAADLPVVFATDAEDMDWVRKVEEAYGWVYLNHSVWGREAGYEHAGWLPSVLDSIVLARGLGLVGTHQSTFSSVAARRVESWQGGVSRTVDPNEGKKKQAEVVKAGLVELEAQLAEADEADEEED